MKNIVVYRLIMVIGFLPFLSTLAAQKPAIDLISSHQQYRHPEAIIDTCFAIDSRAQEPFMAKETNAGDQISPEPQAKKKRRQIGPSLDTIFQKEERIHRKQEKSKSNSLLFIRKINPVKIFIYISALK